MLKWLVTKAPSSPSSLENVITDDPLATLGRKGDKREAIYAVSRVNPIFEEEDGKDDIRSLPKDSVHKVEKTPVKSQNKLPDSPPTDRESVRSSGYGSKEADSVSFKSDSQEDEDLGFKGAEKEVDQDYVREPLKLLETSSGNVAEIRKSFENRASPESPTAPFPFVKANEVELVTKNQSFVESIVVGANKSSHLEVIPESPPETEEKSTSAKKASWPRVNNLAQALQRQSERIHQRRERERLKHHTAALDAASSKEQVLRFNPLVSVVTQNSRYVTAIAVSPNSKSQNPPPSPSPYNNYCNNESNFQLAARSNVPAYLNVNNLQNEYPLLSLQPDSLVNEDTLCMMNYPEYGGNKKRENSQSEENISLGEMPNFGRAVYSGLYSSIKSGSSRTSQESLGMRERNGAKKKGVSVVKDLWEKTGLKTNGRKLLVDVNDLLNERQPINISRKSSFENTAYRSVDFPLSNFDLQSRSKEILERTSSNKSSDTYEHIPSLPNSSSFLRNSSSPSHSYEEISESDRGIDNLAFIDDTGNIRQSSALSSFSKSGGHQFQHNLTEFQKRVSERLQVEPTHRKSWIDVEQANELEGEDDVTLNPKGMIPRAKDIKDAKSLRNHPGRAIRELGLDGNWRKQEWKNHSDNERSNHSNGGPWTLSQNNRNHGNETLYGSFGNKNRKQIWDQFYRRCKDGSIPGYFFPHPNSEAQIFAQNGGFLHDFTIDAKRSQRNQKTSSRSQRRRKCCFIFIILLAFVVFVGAIVGLSLFSTGGERIFGPM